MKRHKLSALAQYLIDRQRHQRMTGRFYRALLNATRPA